MSADQAVVALQPQMTLKSPRLVSGAQPLWLAPHGMAILG